MRKKFIVLLLLMLTAISIVGTTYANYQMQDFEKVGNRIYIVNTETNSIDFQNLSTSLSILGQNTFSEASVFIFISTYQNFDPDTTYNFVLYNYLTEEIFLETTAYNVQFWFDTTIRSNFSISAETGEELMAGTLPDVRNIRMFFIDQNAIDDEFPVISGVDKIIKSPESILIVADVLDLLEATDNLEGNITNNISVESDGFTGNGNVIGSYNITFTVSDIDLNKTDHVVTIDVISGLPQILHFIDDNKIVVDTSMFLDPLEIIQVLTASGLLELDGTSNINFTTNEYLGVESVVGTYQINVDITSSTGADVSFELVIEVVEEQEETIVIVALGFFGEFREFIKNNFPLILGVIIGSSIFGFVYYKTSIDNKKKNRRKKK